MVVFDRHGTQVGRVWHIHPGDPLAVSNDGRRIGAPDDFGSVIPGWSVATEPRVPPLTAAMLLRTGYLELVGGSAPRITRYVPLSEVAEVDEDQIHLAVGVDTLPVGA